MKQYKHYSFDLWETLIKHNENFTKERAKYFFEKFNQKGKSIEEVQSIIKDIGRMCVSINERMGCNIDALEMICMVLHRLEYNMDGIKDRDIVSIYHILDTIFLENPPTLYDENTLQTIRNIKYSGATISILSNTASIKSTTLKRLLIQVGLSDYMTFQLYSDEYGFSKPNDLFFRLMLSYVQQFRKFNPVNQSEIVHIGDNIFTDVHGAERAGIDAIQINSNNLSIKDIL